MNREFNPDLNLRHHFLQTPYLICLLEFIDLPPRSA